MAGLLSMALFAGGCASPASDRFAEGGGTYTRQYKDSTPVEAVDSLLFAYREEDYEAVYHLTKPAGSQASPDRKAFLSEVKGDKDWTPALWQIDTNVAYTGEKTSADVLANVLSDLDGFLYNDTIRFYCFLDGEHWRIAQHSFEGESVLLAPAASQESPKP